jgi:hypothetical protein
LKIFQVNCEEKETLAIGVESKGAREREKERKEFQDSVHVHLLEQSRLFSDIFLLLFQLPLFLNPLCLHHFNLQFEVIEKTKKRYLELL